jgi:flagellar assembly factor FliW
VIVVLDGSMHHAPPEQSMPVVAPRATSPSAPETLSAPAVEGRSITSALLGELTLAPDQIITFPEGLHGFPAEREFALVATARDGFWWLQSTAEEGLVFLLMDPFRAHEGYEVDLGAGDEAFLQITTPDDALVLTVVTLPASATGTATTNLRGPIVFNLARRRARQIVRADDRYALQAVVSI